MVSVGNLGGGVVSVGNLRGEVVSVGNLGGEVVSVDNLAGEVVSVGILAGKWQVLVTSLLIYNGVKLLSSMSYVLELNSFTVTLCPSLNPMPLSQE